VPQETDVIEARMTNPLNGAWGLVMYGSPVRDGQPDTRSRQVREARALQP
jgi:hypothetical protein